VAPLLGNAVRNPHRAQVGDIHMSCHVERDGNIGNERDTTVSVP
jgi:hypothetical protein